MKQDFGCFPAYISYNKIMKKRKNTKLLSTISFLDKSYEKITLDKLEQGMIIFGFDTYLIQDILSLFKERIEQKGENECKRYLDNLHYRTPEEIKDEHFSAQLYDKYCLWFEEEVKKLEGETQLSFEEQTRDIEYVYNKSRMVQLVIRHRLSEIIQEID